MKAEIYIFGNFADGYSQYPDNYTHNLFEAIGKSRQAESEIIYHREGALTYYIYTREISKIDNTFLTKPISEDIWSFEILNAKKSFLPAIPVIVYLDF